MYLIFAIGFGPGVGIFTLILTRSFSPEVNFTGVSVAYNISFALFGGLTPLVNGILIKEFDSFTAPAYYIRFSQE